MFQAMKLNFVSMWKRQSLTWLGIFSALAFVSYAFETPPPTTNHMVSTAIFCAVGFLYYSLAGKRRAR